MAWGMDIISNDGGSNGKEKWNMKWKLEFVLDLVCSSSGYCQYLGYQGTFCLGLSGLIRVRAIVNITDTKGYTK